MAGGLVWIRPRSKPPVIDWIGYQKQQLNHSTIKSGWHLIFHPVACLLLKLDRIDNGLWNTLVTGGKLRLTLKSCKSKKSRKLFLN